MSTCHNENKNRFRELYKVANDKLSSCEVFFQVATHMNFKLTQHKHPRAILLWPIKILYNIVFLFFSLLFNKTAVYPFIFPISPPVRIVPLFMLLSENVNKVENLDNSTTVNEWMEMSVIKSVKQASIT